jgi:D-alanyl-D-alanine carboxypeptidase
MGSEQLSKHSYGNAFDINPRQNIYIRYDEQNNEIYRIPKDGSCNPSAAGTLTQDHPLVLLMKDKGWTWGGNWGKEDGRVDYQHFEK